MIFADFTMTNVQKISLLKIVHSVPAPKI